MSKHHKFVALRDAIEDRYMDLILELDPKAQGYDETVDTLVRAREYEISKLEAQYEDSGD
jgi:hypothetical protein